MRYFIIIILIFSASFASNSNEVLELLEYSEKHYAKKPRQALDSASKALKLARQSGDTALLIKSGINIGKIFYYSSYYEKATDNFLHAAKLSDNNKYRSHEAEAYLHLGLTYNERGKPDSSITFYKKALNIYKKSLDSAAYAMVMFNIADPFHAKGQYREAEQRLKQAININDTLGILENTAKFKNKLGNVLMANGKTEEAIDYFKEALTFYEKNKEKVKAAETKNYLGLAHANLGNYRDGSQFLLKALNEYEEAGELQGEIKTYRNLANVEYKHENYQKAFDYLEKALENQNELFRKNIKRQNLEKVIQTTMEEKDLLESEFEQAEKENLKLKLQEKNRMLEIQRKNNQRNILLIVLLLLIVVAVFLFRAIKVKKRSNQLLEDKNIQIEDQNTKLEKLNRDLSDTNKKITDSIRYARTIQNALLPDMDEISELFDANFILYKPRDMVSGDFYWGTMKNGKRIMILADCTGHGVPGALMSVMGHTLLNEIVNAREITDPSLILEQLDDHVRSAFSKNNKSAKDGMDVSVLVYDESNSEVTYSGARRPLYYIESNELKEIKGEKRTIGGILKKSKKDRPFRDHNIKIENTHVFYLTTDGYADQNDPGRKKFGNKNLKSFLEDIGNKSMSEQKQQLAQALHDFKKDEDYRDDITIVGIRIK